jgi:hypothetical protein
MPRINISVAGSGGRTREQVFFLNPKNRCKRCGVVASFDAIVTPPTQTLFHISLSVSGPAALLSPLTLVVVNLGTR